LLAVFSLLNLTNSATTELPSVKSTLAGALSYINTSTGYYNTRLKMWKKTNNNNECTISGV
jgi:hypothetical protein